MIIKVERSGGFTGIPISSEINANDLPSTLMLTAKKIMSDHKAGALPLKSIPRGAADHYTFKISINDGTKHKLIECDQFNIGDELKSLVDFIEKNSKSAKR
jgi:emfourin